MDPISSTSDIYKVALRKESVDRNVSQVMHIHAQIPSLSARRAWIEISFWYSSKIIMSSLSARRAWIEIHCR